MYSRGSVIPLFVSQLKTGKPITITDPNMTRFLMSLAESVDLVLHAWTQGESGDLFVRKAPASTVETLVLALAELFEVKNPQIQNIGTRHGEKLYESLLGVEERANAQDQGGYFRVPLDTRDLNYSVYFEQGQDHAEELESYHSHNTERLDIEGVKAKLLTLPEIQAELGR